MASPTRAKRVADRISQELAVLLQREVADPRFAMLTVTDVEVDRELSYATVYVSSVDPAGEAGEILKALEKARGFFRSKLAERISLRQFPQLRFRWDTTSDRGARVDELLEMLRSRPASGTDEG